MAASADELAHHEQQQTPGDGRPLRPPAAGYGRSERPPGEDGVRQDHVGGPLADQSRPPPAGSERGRRGQQHEQADAGQDAALADRRAGESLVGGRSAFLQNGDAGPLREHVPSLKSVNH
jgi:hypothetical protein